MTKQEMFDLAWKGLAAQGWQRAYVEGSCVYKQELPDGTIRRCAWGHVDHAVPADIQASVTTLNGRGIGLAAKLGYLDMRFAQELQNAHDGAATSAEMEAAFRDLAADHRLVVPE